MLPHMLISHLAVLLRGPSVLVFCLFSDRRVFLLLSWSGSLYLTGRSPLSDVCLAESFLPFTACPSTLTMSLLMSGGFKFYYSPIHMGFSPRGSLFFESC